MPSLQLSYRPSRSRASLGWVRSGLGAKLIVGNGIPGTRRNFDHPRFADAVIRHRYIGDRSHRSEVADIYRIPPIGKRGSGNKIVNVVSADNYIMHSTVGTGVIVACPYPEG
jgi:hypothetical protein